MVTNSELGIRSTPICGECGHFRVDAKRTPSPYAGGYPCRMGTCRKFKQRYDRCDLQPDCHYFYPVRKMTIPPPTGK